MFNPDNTSEWWYGWNSLPTADQRNTVRHHEYIFKPDGSFEFKTNGFTVRPVAGFYLAMLPKQRVGATMLVGKPYWQRLQPYRVTMLT